jgi:hypothetical protein
MMATLLEVREVIKRFYEKNDIYVKMAAKFILAFVSFLMISSKIGFMQQLRGPLVAVALAAVCCLIPLNGMVVISGILIIAHAFALSLEVCLVTAAFLVIVYLLYFRISSKLGILMVIAPMCFMLGIPYVIPLLGGLLYGVAAAVPAACGTVVYYLLKYMSQNSTSLGTGEAEGGAMKVVSLIESLTSNKEMYLCILAMVLTVLIVYFIRRLSVDHSWEWAIGIGSMVNIVVHLTGALLPQVTVKIVGLLLGSIISAIIAFIVKFFVFSVDYTRTERVQFEDDEYYYYVKAVPKNVIAAPKKTVKKIVSQKKQTKIIKKIDS